MKLFVLYLVLWSATPILAQNSTQPISVCEALARLNELNGSLVEIRGWVSPGQGLWISGEACSRRLIVGGVTFENLIALTDPRAPDVTLHKAPYTWNEESITQFELALKKARLMKTRVRTSVVGILETRMPISALVDNRFPTTPFGFGVQNIAPAQVLIKEFRKVFVEVK